VDLFHLYVILDIFSRYVVGWMVAPHESAVLAERLIADTCTKQGIASGQLTLHADRGASMRSKPVALLLADLGVVKTHSRPYVSNDNPFSESHFKTLKYCPDFPTRFGSIEDGRAFGRRFFAWYNDEHHHSGLGFLPPAVVHHGLAEGVRARRQHVLTAAYAAHPERFVKGTPRLADLPRAVWINPPEQKKSRSGCPTIDDRHLGRPAGRPDFSLMRPIGLNHHRHRRDTDDRAAGVSMSFTASADSGIAHGSCVCQDVMIENVCRIPADFRALQTRSVVDLVKSSGYLDDPDSLTVEAVTLHLRSNPGLVDAWLMYSRDKRSRSGWYIRKAGDGKYEVGWYPDGERLALTDSVLATAEFIVREMGTIRKHIGQS
jgi:hypothetical protein